MPEHEMNSKLTTLIWLQAATLVAMLVGAAVMAFGLLPKIERVVEVTERVETRFQHFADEVQPVMAAGAGKAIDAIEKMDAGRLSETATEKTDDLIEAAAARAKRLLEGNQPDSP